jgi:hypothetical protein
VTASDRRIAVGVFVVAFVTFAWFFGGGGWNQNAHYDLTRALVERQTFHIDGYRVNTGDISWNRDRHGEYHAYSNKPPGLPFLAAIPYAALHAIETRMHLSVDSWRAMTINVWILTLITVALPGALIPVLLYQSLTGVSRTAAVCVALVTAFATIVFPYSTVFYSPVPAAFFLLLAFVWLDDRPLLAGAAAGVAGMCFYLCILAAAVFAIALKRRALRFILGGLPFGILLAIYHTVCFGAPWRTSLGVAKAFTEKDLFLGLFRLPTWTAFWGITFSEYRGLFFVSPILLLAFVGAVHMPRKRELAMIGAIVALFIGAVSSFNGWEGGFAFGPRHILPMIPLLAMPIAFVRGKVWIAIGIVLSIASVSMQFIAAAVDVQPDASIRYPVRDYLLPNFLKGNVSVNEQTVDELIPHRLYREGSQESRWAAFNLGELFLPPALSWIPIALWMIAGSATLVARARRGDGA